MSTQYHRRHSYWDGLLGRSTKVGNVLNEVVLIKSTQKKDSALELDPVIWSLESFKLGREDVYLNGKLKGSSNKEEAPPVPDNYGKDSKKIGEKRIALAGYMLARILVN